MLPRRKRRGFSGSVCPNGLRERLTGVPLPKNVQGRVLVTVENESAGGTDRGTHGQAREYPFATARTILRGERGRERFPRLPAHAAVHVRIRRKAYQPASLLAGLRPALRLAPLCS